MKIMKKKYILVIILGILMVYILLNRLEIKKGLQQQPSLYMVGCSDLKHGLYNLDGDLENKEVLTSELFDTFAGLDYHKRENKIIAYVIDKGVIEYDLSTNKSHILINDEDMKRYKEELKPERKGNVQLCYIRYCPDPNNISFIYGNWGMAGGEGKLYIYNKEKKDIREICRLNTQGGYCWSQDSKRIYFIRNEQLICKNLITGDEEQLIENVVNFSVSGEEHYIAVWREKQYENSSSYRLYIYNRTTGEEKHIVNAPYWGRLTFSPDESYLAYLRSNSGILGSLLGGRKPTLSVYDISKSKILKKIQGNYNDIWGDISW